MYKLKAKNGIVSTLLKSGKDFVKTDVKESFAKKIIEEVGCKKSDREDYQILVQDQWYFEGTYEEDEQPVLDEVATKEIFKKKKEKYR